MSLILQAEKLVHATIYGSQGKGYCNQNYFRQLALVAKTRLLQE